MDAPLTPSNLFLSTRVLPADVTLIILEELHKVQHISDLRVVSKQFDALIVPLSYRHVHLTGRILAPFALKQELYDPSIVRLQVARDVRIERSELPMIKGLLFERPRLQKLHLVHGKSGISTDDGPKIEVHGDQSIKRLPALKALIIDGYNWKHSLWEGTNLWNWSDITHLELKSLEVENFLCCVPRQCFSGLKTLIERCTVDFGGQRTSKKSTMMCSLLKHTTALEELRTKCNSQNSEIIPTIARYGSHLRTLKLGCYSLRIGPWWIPLTVDQLKAIRSGCPQLMEIEVDLALPSSPQTSSTSSKSTSQPATTPAPTIMTRSMTRVQNAKCDTTGTDRDDTKARGIGESVAQQEIPWWYINAYSREKYHEPSYVSMKRIQGLKATAEDQRIDFAQADDEYKNWKRSHRMEEVDALRNQVHSNPASALAGFRNLRRLTIFARINHFVAPESNESTFTRTRAAVKIWLTNLLLTKEGASFEEVVIHVRSEVVNEEFPVQTEKLISKYEYAGRRNFDGDAEIREDIGHGVCIDMTGLPSQKNQAKLTTRFFRLTEERSTVSGSWLECCNQVS